MFQEQREICVSGYSEYLRGLDSLDLIVGVSMILRGNTHYQDDGAVMVSGCFQPVLSDIDETAPYLNEPSLRKPGYVHTECLPGDMQLSSKVGLGNVRGEDGCWAAAFTQKPKNLHRLLRETLQRQRIPVHALDFFRNRNVLLHRIKRRPDICQGDSDITLGLP